jgi:hypothetical protein
MKKHTRLQKRLAKKIHMRNPANRLYPSNFTATWCGAWITAEARFTSKAEGVTCHICKRNAREFALARLTK